MQHLTPQLISNDVVTLVDSNSEKYIYKRKRGTFVCKDFYVSVDS